MALGVSECAWRHSRVPAEKTVEIGRVGESQACRNMSDRPRREDEFASGGFDEVAGDQFLDAEAGRGARDAVELRC